MSVLQAYQADLLKDLDLGKGVPQDEVHRASDLALWAIKQAACSAGHSIVALASFGIFGLTSQG